MLRIKDHEHLNDEWKVELVETIKDYVPECSGHWDAKADWRNGIKNPYYFRSKLMNTLTLIKKQIEKAAALHDAQIAMTSYRGVKFECKQGDADEVHGTFCYRGHTYQKWGVMDKSYVYHYDDMDKDSRPPACYQLTYRGVTYWSCYRIHLKDYFEQLLTVQPVFNRRGWPLSFFANI